VYVPSHASNVSETIFTVKNVNDLAARNMTLIIQDKNISYHIRARSVDTEAIMAQMDTNDPAEVPFIVTITSNADERTRGIVDTAVTAIGTAERVLPPMQFTVTARYGGKTVDITEFLRFLTRNVEITEQQARSITTAIVVEPDGTIRHVPTNVHTSGGKWYASIFSLTNSAYALISNEVTFPDATGRWYASAANEAGSRRIVIGIGNNVFAGDRDITRAEFAAILVNAMGLPANGNGTVFTDVPANAWYAGAVGKAYEYGLVLGIGNNEFAPTIQITREEAMLMIRRAARLAEFEGATGNLNAFTDARNVSSWALEAAQWNVGSGLIIGEGDRILAPKDNITRAETAMVVLRLLRAAGLVDNRSN